MKVGVRILGLQSLRLPGPTPFTRSKEVEDLDFKYLHLSPGRYGLFRVYCGQGGLVHTHKDSLMSPKNSSS